MTQTAVATALQPESSGQKSLGSVSDLLRLFGQAVRAHQLYLPNNPVHARAMDTLRAAFSALWDDLDVLVLQITESQFTWEGRVALNEAGRTGESLPWIFYKDGIRELEMRPGVEENDVLLVLGAIQRARVGTGDDDDLLTILWEHDFSFFTYRYVELGLEGAGAVPAPAPLPEGSIEPPAETERDTVSGSAPAAQPASPFARMDDYDPTLYFLDESEIAYLQASVSDDFESDPRPSVISALLDTFEREDDPTVREEICGILEDLLLALLANLRFRGAACLLREAQTSAANAPNLIPSHSARLSDLVRRMSESAVLGQLFTALESVTLGSPQSDLNELLGQLEPTALEWLLRHTAQTFNPAVRTLVERAVMRLAAANTAELVRLVDSEEETVAMEAIRRAGDLRTPAAVVALGRLLRGSVTERRRAAVTALAAIASPGAMQALEPALEDDDREVRVAAVRAIAARAYRAGLARIERAIRDRLPRESDLTEKMAFFEAFGSLAGEGGVGLLDEMLNRTRLMAKRASPETRACAAVALGRIGTPAALEALQRATADKEVVVRNAASRALRGGPA